MIAIYIFMLTIISICIFIYSIFYVIKTAEKRGQYNEWSQSGVVFFISATIIMTILVISFLIGTLEGVGDQNTALRELDFNRHKVEIIATQRLNVEKDIRSQLDKYPEIEKNIITNITTDILLQYPQLKSNETITTGFNKLNELNVASAEVQTNIVDNESKVRFNENSPTSFRFPGLFVYSDDYLR